MASQQQRAKAWGREVERAALRSLSRVFPRLRRQGSVRYTRAAPDLVQDPLKDTDLVVNIVAHRDKHRPLLVTMSVLDFVFLTQATDWVEDVGVRVQVKGRARSWIGRVYDELTGHV